MMIEQQSTGSASPTGLALYHSGEESVMSMPKTIAITVSGGYHNMGEIIVRAKVREAQRSPMDEAGPGRCLIAELNDSQLAKISRHMCGMSDCSCGGGYGDVWEAPDGWERTGAAEWARDLSA